jgi:hypothetical protein
LLDLVDVRRHVDHRCAGIADLARANLAGHADYLQRLLRSTDPELLADRLAVPQPRRQPLVDDDDAPAVTDVVVRDVAPRAQRNPHHNEVAGHDAPLHADHW